MQYYLHVLHCVLQVCRRWQLLCHTPSLWSAKPLVGDINNIQDIPRLIKSLPFLNLLHLKDVSDPVFQAILAHPNLQEVDLSDTNIRGVQKTPKVTFELTPKLIPFLFAILSDI